MLGDSGFRGRLSAVGGQLSAVSVVVEVGFEGVEGGVDVGEVAGAAEGEGAGVGEDATAEEEVAGLAAGGLHEVVVVGVLHQAGDGVDAFDGGEGKGAFVLRLGPLEEVELAEGEGMVEGAGAVEGEAVLVVAAENLGEGFGGCAELLEGAAPELEGRCDGDDEGVAGILRGLGRAGARAGVEEADVVGDDGVAAAIEEGGEGGFAGAGVAEEGDHPVTHADGAGVQGVHAGLVAEGGEDGREEVGADVGGEGVGGGLDEDLAAVADEEVGDAGDAEEVLLAGGEPAGLVGDDVFDVGGDGGEADGDGV